MNNLHFYRVSKRQKFCCFLIIVFVLFLFTTIGNAEYHDIVVKINDQPIETDVAPTIIEGRTLVPFRAIFEALGAEVEWDGEKERVIGKRGDTNITLHVDNELAIINDSQKYLDVPPTIIDGRTMVPTRFIAESLGAEVEWDGSKRVVDIYTDTEPVDPSPEEPDDPIEEPEKREILSTSEIIELVEPATVKIENHWTHGSGFFISPDGEVATNAHVVRGSKWIEVTTHDGKQYSADIKKIDNAVDLAILKIESQETFPYLDQFCFKDEISRGEEILAFGNPLVFEQTVTKGIISNITEEEARAWIYTREIIQHDASIAPGSSGGALVNPYGDLVGINFAGDKWGFGFNFAISADKLFSLKKWEHSYDLQDDFSSYWTEHYRWEEQYFEDVLYWRDEATSALDNNLFSTAKYSLNNALNRENQYYQEVANYYPVYSEIEQLKSLNLERLDAFREYCKYIIYVIDYPYHYSEQEFDRLANNYQRLEQEYYNKIEEFREKFGI